MCLYWAQMGYELIDYKNKILKHITFDIFRKNFEKSTVHIYYTNNNIVLIVIFLFTPGDISVCMCRI